ncbi:glycosyl transferase [Pistricoccus aurantiacus]|uniref:Glycosyl transferase n=1 Tax=Pistricoccus aurantiacus TaxID=1883414 RepID=A0A5B8ST58_9GAMM|nr:glycosyltransferase [Pistricoccus aurantiacus]QEA39481.1 glycosyl transferase [Pistricoccus aurantiacus]
MQKRISFFIHHQGRGHAQRARAIIQRFSKERPVTVMTADPSLFENFERPIDIIALPDMIGADVPTTALYQATTPSIMHCVPLGVKEMRRTMRLILDHLDDSDTGLFVIDVSAELALLARIASVPAVKIRMHGDRSDRGHLGAYECCIGMLAPYDERLEQPDYPDWARAKTHYTGGLCTTDTSFGDKQAARRKLGLPSDQEVIVVLTGGGGAGTPYAPLTVAARAATGSRFITIGPVHREGHETDFFNLENHGWVTNVTDYLVASDIVLASAGDNTVHEIARIGRPYICAPEWRYYGEQVRKAECLQRLGAAIHLENWPSSIDAWQELLMRARELDVSTLRELYSPQAARTAAQWLENLTDRLWQDDRKTALLGHLQEAVANPGIS